MATTAPMSRQSIASAQGMALAQRIDGEIGMLRPRYFTPNEAEVPSSASQNPRKTASHMPMSIALAAQQKLAKSNIPKVTLDGFLLLESAGMALPEDARQAQLADRSLGHVVEDDFEFFTGLIVVDVSENFLQLSPFGSLPRLKELRIACNNIQTIDELYGFDHLSYLDLSYNRLTLRSVQSLDVLPSLRDLDLSGNNLRGLPVEMYRFRCLERLVIDNNKIDDINVFAILCTIPNLRVLSVAYNYLWKVAPECCMDRYFRMLSVLDISFNYFSSERDVEALVDLPRLATVMLYGNPVLGPQGEDPQYIYIESLVDAASEARLAVGKQEIDWVTEVPRSRVLKKGVPAGRKATYRDFSIVQVEPDAGGVSSQPRTAREWRDSGNQTIFAEAIAAARKEQMAAMDNDNTFLTTLHHDDDALANSVAEGVMDRVAGEMGLRTSAEVLLLRDKAALGRTAVNIEEETESKIAHSENVPFLLRGLQETPAEDERDIEDKLPSTLLGRSMSNPTPLTTHPIAVKTAMRALQYAIQHPMTNHNEVPAKGLLPPKDYVRPTLSSIKRKLPRSQKTNQQLEARARLSEEMQAKRDAGRGLPEPLRVTAARRKARDETLVHIESVLDGLNAHSENLLSKKAQNMSAEQVELMKGFARPTTGLRSLVQMVEEVVHDLDS